MPKNDQVGDAELRAYRTEVRNSIFRQIHKRLALVKETEKGFTQESMASVIGMDARQLSRLLKGENGMQLDTLSDLARALNCRIVATLEPLEAHQKSDRPAVYVINSPEPQAELVVRPVARTQTTPSYKGIK